MSSTPGLVDGTSGLACIGTTNGTAKESSSKSSTAGLTSGAPELSNAERKKLAKAEKAVKRQKDKAGTEQQPTAPLQTANGVEAKDAQRERPITSSKPVPAKPQKESQHTRSGSTGVTGKEKQQQQQQQQQQQLPVRRRPSQSAGASTSASGASSSVLPAKKAPIPFYSHLAALRPVYPLPQTNTSVHPCIATLANQIRTHKLTGSQARTVGLLLSIKALISTYTTPQHTSLPRHMSGTFLTPQLTHLKTHSRPLCTAQATAIRWLKNTIATLDPSLPEEEAKTYIASQIDTFIKERFTVADQVIASEVATTWIEDEDVVVVYGKSVVVTRCLREAVRRGRRFKVIAVDSRPLHEGRAMARSLRTLKPPDSDGDDEPEGKQTGSNNETCPDEEMQLNENPGIETTLLPLTSLSAYLSSRHHGIVKCILGAHTLLSNGAVQARSGTAMVALAVKSFDPGASVLVAAESVKCSERVVVDGGGGGGELGGEDGLIERAESDATHVGQEAESKDSLDALGAWRETPNLHIANLLYDITLPELIDMLVTEVASAAPCGAAVIGRVAGGVGEGGVV